MMKRRPFISSVIAFLMLFGLAWSAQAQTIYVRAGAAGAKNGTDWANAYTALPATLQRGATYYVATGTYSGYTLTSPTSGSTLVTVKKATSTDHGTSTGWSDTYGNGAAVFQGQFQINASYVLIDGQTGGGPSSWTNGYGFKLYSPPGTSYYPVVWIREGSANVTLKHCEVQGQGYQSTPYGGGSWANDGFDIGFAQSGDGSKPAQYVTISHVYVHDVGRCIYFARVNHFLAEYIYGGKYTYHDSAHAEIASMWGSMTRGEPISSSLGDYTFANSIYSHLEGSGGLMVSGVGIKIYNNVFFRPSGVNFFQGNGAVATWTGDTTMNAEIYNNTFIDLGSSIPALGLSFSAYSTGNVVKNNIFYNCGVSFGQVSTHDYNLFINTTGDSASSEAHGATATSAIFKNYLALDFGLTANTPAGATLPSPFNVDPSGVVRTTWTRGAYEYTSATAGSLAVSPSIRNFGSIMVGTTADQTFTIQNVGGASLSGSASVAAPFSIISGSPYNLAAGQSQTVTMRYTPTSTGTNTQTVTFTGANGASCQVTGIAVPVPAPVISVTPATLSFGSLPLGSTSNLTVTVKNTGSGTLSGSASVAAPFSIVSGSPYNLAAGQTQSVTVRFSPTVVDTQTQPITFTGAGGASVLAAGSATVISTTGVISATAGAITTPFVVANGAIYQPATTTLTTGGRAVYTITVTNSGDYAIQALVNAPSSVANSFYMNIDAEPQDPVMIWDINTPTSGFENRLISWRGNGTSEADEITPKYFTLSAGTHQVIIIGREGNTALQSFSVKPRPVPPQGLRISP